MNHTTVRPRTMRRASDELRCDVRSTFGYQGKCGCGWTGKVWGTYREATLEATFHTCPPVDA